MTHGDGWRDQWQRIERWRERVRASRDEFRRDDLGTEGYRDEVFALFQAIWHLRDWVHHDPQLALTRQDVDQWIKSSCVALPVAHDLANGSKHMVLSRDWAGGAKQTRNDVTVAVGVGVKHVFYIQDLKRKVEYEAVALADECIEEWSRLLSQGGPIADPHRPD